MPKNTSSRIVANQEYCFPSNSGSVEDVRALGVITMLLMQKYHSDNGDLGIEDTQRWSLDSDAVQFLIETNAAKPTHELIKVSSSIVGVNTT